MNYPEQITLPSEKVKRFLEVPFNVPKVIIDGDGLETHGLIACIAIAGFFEGSHNIAFMTHRGAKDFTQNLNDVIDVADQYKLRSISGTLFIFRQDESIMHTGDYSVDRSRCNYQDIIERIRDGLTSIFGKAHIIEVRYGKKSTANTGDAILDLKEKRYRTDIEEGVF